MLEAFRDRYSQHANICFIIYLLCRLSLFVLASVSSTDVCFMI